MFIAIEGVDGCGKTTLIEGLKKHFENRSDKFCFTKEPGGSEVGDKISDLIKSTQVNSPVCEMFLFLAARAEHVETLIKPALQSRKVVISDRYNTSTMAYGVANGIEFSKINEINSMFFSNFEPDLIILVDIPHGVAMDRYMTRPDVDLGDFRFMRKHFEITQNYLLMSYDRRFIGIDGTMTKEKVLEHAIHVIEQKIGKL